MTLEPAVTVAGYRIERLLGSGGMGTVYLAVQESLKRPVALKLLSPQLSADDTFRERFRREGEVQAALDHPHIVPIYEAGATAEGQLYIAMRFVRGSTLKELVETGDVDPARTLRLLAPIASALDAAHTSGLIHRDVKPHNVLVDQTDWPYLADFGLTRGGDVGPTRTGQIVGTFAYISPEQVKGSPGSPRSDQYALAAMLFECLAGNVAHNQASDAALLYAKVHEPTPRLSERSPSVPRGLDDVLARGMAHDPEDRYPTTSALIEAATDVLERQAATAPRTATLEPLVKPETPLPQPPPTPTPAAGRPPTPTEWSARTPPPATQQPYSAQAGENTIVFDTAAEQADTAPPPSRSTRSSSRRKSPRAEASRSLKRQLPRSRLTSLPHPALAAGAGILILCAVAVALIAATSGNDESGSRTNVRAGGVALQMPPGWVQTSSIPRIPGLTLQRQRAYTPARGRPAAMLVGAVNASGETLLPRTFRRTLPDSKPTGQPVRMGQLQALRYPALKPSGTRAFMLLAAPTTNGVVTALCFGAAGQRAACESALRSARLLEPAKPLPLEPLPEYARQASAVLNKLASDRMKIRTTFDEAKTPRGQGTQADRLADRYTTASRAFAELSEAGPRERATQGRMSSSLSDVAESLRIMADAAKREDRETYANARAAVERREAAVGRVLSEFEGLGYRLR